MSPFAASEPLMKSTSLMCWRFIMMTVFNVRHPLRNFASQHSGATEFVLWRHGVLATQIASYARITKNREVAGVVLDVIWKICVRQFVIMQRRISTTPISM